MIVKRRQTSLPAELTDPASRDPVNARGYPGKFDPPSIQSAKSRGVIGRAVDGMVRIFTTPKITMRTYSATIDVISKQVFGYNPRRKYLALQNNGTVDIWVCFGGTAQSNTTFKMSPNTVWTFDGGYVAVNEMTAIASTAATLSITEGIIGE